MATITRSNAERLRDSYKNTSFDHQKNIEAALFSIEEVKLFIENLPQEATHLKIFLVKNDAGFIDMCMTGSPNGTAPIEQIDNGKAEIDVAGANGPELLLSLLPCPPHCGQGNGGTSVNGLDSKYVTG